MEPELSLSASEKSFSILEAGIEQLLSARWNSEREIEPLPSASIIVNRSKGETSETNAGGFSSFVGSSSSRSFVILIHSMREIDPELSLSHALKIARMASPDRRFTFRAAVNSATESCPFPSVSMARKNSMGERLDTLASEAPLKPGIRGILVSMLGLSNTSGLRLRALQNSRREMSSLPSLSISLNSSSTCFCFILNLSFKAVPSSSREIEPELSASMLANSSRGESGG
mmetsp:Transcript_28382/g.70512  ORF Transcript_28382/g.70512 Transcript_28382/m.70512 type:complete len:230 (+) Transcript_28382:633-1322(+)